MRVVFWLATILAALLLGLFTIANVQVVDVRFWPLLDVSAPLFLVVLVGMLAGFVIGALVAWAGGGKRRRAARDTARRLAALERELAATQARLAAPHDAAPARRFAAPALPAR